MDAWALLNSDLETEPWPDDGMDARLFPKESQIDVPEDVCGNGFVEPWRGEDCDGENLNSAVCEDLGYDGGRLSCTDECRYNASDCLGSFCGNGFVDDGESCDFQGSSSSIVCPEDNCADVRCDENCNAVASGTCGDGILQYPDESCDGEAFFPIRFTLSGPDYDPDSLRCLNCRIDYSDATPAVCGNSRVERGEECDEGLARFNGGPLDERRFCEDCVWVAQPGSCGDGVVQSDFDERCDGEFSTALCGIDPDSGEEVYYRCRDCRVVEGCPPGLSSEPESDAGALDGSGPDESEGESESESESGCSTTSRSPAPIWLIPGALAVLFRRRKTTSQ
jgi:uncharacterized protein (TIGR03382 family)